MRTNITKFLTAVLAYYRRTSKVGHTRALFSGLGYLEPTSSKRPYVVTHAKVMGRILSPDHNVSLEELPTFLPHRREALLWDNQALMEVFQAALDHIDRLEGRLIDVQATLHQKKLTNPITVEGEAVVLLEATKDGEAQS